MGIQFFLDLVRFPFLQHALAAGLLSSIACGLMGSYITVKRITYIAGAIAHCVLGGMGAARYLNVVAGFSFLSPLHGALAAAILAAFIIGAVTLFSRQRVDTVLSAIWAVGMALGVLFIYMTPGYAEDLMSYLFGNILMVKPDDLFFIAVLDMVIMSVMIIFYNKILAVSFDPEYARIRGIAVHFYSFVLLILTALTIVILIQVVGIVLVIALLSLPAATASYFSKQLWQMMVLSVILSLFYIILGLYVSYDSNLPAGATIIVLAGFIYLVTIIIKNIIKYKKRKSTV
ncbi:MAG: metal ABC transporter permease [Spirochaetales bacterium]|nr:metal ABC transporter permease [Spirochaetales bacterium]